MVWDVNGDGAKDAVVRDNASGKSSTLLNRGNSETPQLADEAVSLSESEDTDLDALSVADGSTDNDLLALDADGDGTRQYAVKAGDDWYSLGCTGDSVLEANPGEANKASSPATKDDAPPVAEAAQRYQRLVGELALIVPAAAWDKMMSAPSDGRRSAGFLQMMDGTVDPSWLKSGDMNADNLGALTMMDSFGNMGGAFSPFGIGLELYFEDIGSADGAGDDGESGEESSHGRRANGGAQGGERMN
jgi:hypothetical protein